MGKLQSIELYNFKSYRGIQRAEFGTAHFTSIIGPNGSGKSNMMDAISFVLGVRSKELRSNHAKDLIYRNRTAANDNNESDNEKENGQVSNGGDPNDAYVKAIYVKTNGEQMELKRSVNLNGTSQYRISNERVSAEAYSDALAKENILIKAKNFLVFQGDVDAIAAQDPKDLCKLFEQISGSIDLKAEFESLENEKLQETTRQMALNQDKKRCAQDVKQLVEQKNETEKYQKKIEARAKVLQDHLLWRLYHCELHAERKNRELQDANKEIKNAEQELTTEQQTCTTMESGYAKAKKKAQDVDRKIKSQNREIDSCKQDMNPIDAKSKMVESKIVSAEKKIEQIQNEKLRCQTQVEKHQRNIEVSNRALQQFEQETSSKLKQGLNITEDDIKEFQSLKDDYMSQTANEQSQMASVSRSKYTANDELQRLQSHHSRLTEKLESLNTELEEQKQKMNELTSAVNENNTTRASKREELNEISQQERQRQRKLQELNDKLRKTIQELSDYDAVQHESRKERQLRENGASLKRYFPGVEGFIHDLVDAEQEKYRTAVATVIGRHMNSIVTDTSRTAKDCIAYLKDNRMPPMTFIPMDSIDVRPIRSDYRGIARGARLAVETVRYPAEIEIAVQYVCEDTMICDDMDVSKHVRWTKRAHVKTVTLDGSVIHKSNLMTGGSGSSNVNQWTDSKVRNLRNLCDQLKDEIYQVNQDGSSQIEERLNRELSDLDGKLEAQRNKLNQYKEIVFSRESEGKNCKKELETLQPQIEQAEQEIEQLEAQYANIESSIENVQRQIFGEFCQRLGVENFKQFDQNQSSAQQKVTQERNRHEQQLRRLQQLLESSQSQLQDQINRIERKQKEVEADKVSLSQLKEEKLQLENRLEEMNGRIRELQDEHAECQKEIDVNKQSVKEYHDRRNAAEKKVEQLRQDAELVRQDMHAYNTTRFNMLRDCRMEGTDLKLIEGSLDSIQLAQLEPQEEEDEEGDVQMTEQDDDASNIVIDYEDLADDYKESDDPEVGQHLLERAETLAVEMENARSKVDLQAGTKLEERREKLRELEQEFTLMQQHTKEVNQRYQEVLNSRREKFMAAFNHISERIQDIYKELTASANVPSGGTANMYVENEEEPWLGAVNYGAMPPLKRYQPMELLSGGEKTMAAMALLFAIHSFQPSPFFVLDEIDAALDNANVASIARYINNHCGDNFQFIVISLKQGLFEHSESLVGIHRNQVENSSKALMLDLRA